MTTLTSDPRRRDFLLATAALLTAPLATGAQAASGSRPVKLAVGDRDLFRVRMTIEAKGNLLVSKNALVSREQHRKLPIKSDALMDYEERHLRPEGAEVGSVVTAAQRYYHTAENHAQVNRNELQPTLRDSVRDTLVRRELLPETIYAVDDYFRSEELELLQVPVCSTAIDELLPHEDVRQGSEYKPSRHALASVLNLSSVEASDVQATVAKVTDREVRIELQGKLDGSVEGVPTTLRLIAKLTFNRTYQSTTWLAMAIHETREISKAKPGFDIAATIKLRREPLEQPMALSARPATIDFSEGAPAERLFIELQSSELGIATLMTRKWRMMSDLPGAAMMRMIDNDRSIAQCDFRSLVDLEPGKKWSLEAFENEVRSTLGEQLSEMTEVDEFTSASGLRVLRVTARGAVENVPIQWHVLHFSNEDGRRILATFTMEAENAAAFAGSDAQLASTLRMLPQSAGETAKKAAVAVDARPTAATPETASQSANEVKASDLRQGQVQSAGARR